MLLENVALVVRNDDSLGKDAYNIKLPVFNTCNVTGYLEGASVAMHKDNEVQHSHDLIASVLFGGGAWFSFKARVDGATSECKVYLAHGDLLLFDRNIPHKAEGNANGKFRLNLTFRQFRLPWYRIPGQQVLTHARAGAGPNETGSMSAIAVPRTSAQPPKLGSKPKKTATGKDKQHTGK